MQTEKGRVATENETRKEELSPILASTILERPQLQRSQGKVRPRGAVYLSGKADNKAARDL